MLATDQGRRGVLVTLVGDVAANYFLLRELDLSLGIARRTLAVNDQTVTYFRNRLDGGVSNRLEARPDPGEPGPDRDGDSRLRAAGGGGRKPDLAPARPVPGPIARASVNLEPPPPPLVPPGVPASLLERRPDVAQAEQFLVAANADIGAAKALFFPNISLNAFLGGANGNIAETLGGIGGLWSAGAQLLQPVYQGGRLRRNLESARARFDEALALYQKAALNGYREVADALISIQKLSEMRVQRQSAVTDLRDAADLARARYDTGLANYIEILTADERLFDDELLLAQTVGAEFRARTDLYRALGGGWQP